jgi:acetyl-CoA carboxylase biotin carboxylase subunit
MIEAGVPCSRFSWYFRIIRTSATLSREFGFPVMLKQLLVVEEKECVPFGKKRRFTKLEGARQESAAFGNDGMYLEKLIEEPRHSSN